MSRDQWFINGIAESVVFKDLTSDILEKTEGGETLAQIAAFMIEEVQREAAVQGISVTTGALNKTSGAWNESVMELHFIKSIAEINEKLTPNDGFFVSIRLPSSNLQSGVYSRFMNLFSAEEFSPSGRLEWYSDKLDKIFFPSPDVVIAKISGEGTISREQVMAVIQDDTTSSSHRVFHFLKGKLKAEQVYGTVSLKTTTRPDRRYQAMYEAEIVKAIAQREGLDWRCGFITSGRESRMDKQIYETSVGIQAILLSEPGTRFADAWRFHERQMGLTEWLEAFLQR